MERCKKQYFKNWSNYQCQNKAWKDGFCKIHHPDTIKARRDKSAKRWEEKWKKDEDRFQKTEESKKDTERLDFLEKNAKKVQCVEIFGEGYFWSVGLNYNSYNTLREAIDREMELENENYGKKR